MRLARALVPLALLLAPAVDPALAQAEDPFLRTFAAADSLDRAGLADFLHGVSAELDAGRARVASLRVAAEERDRRIFGTDATETMRGRFAEYAGALGELRTATATLREAPAATRALFRAVAAGHRACWLLDVQVDLAEVYGATADELSRVRPSHSACRKFRHVVFDERVVEAIAAELAGGDALARENAVLREELAALETLLEDLRALEAE